jgi:hypothetical protein
MNNFSHRQPTLLLGGMSILTLCDMRGQSVGVVGSVDNPAVMDVTSEEVIHAALAFLRMEHHRIQHMWH